MPTIITMNAARVTYKGARRAENNATKRTRPAINKKSTKATPKNKK
jgi:hypothetical protein